MPVAAAYVPSAHGVHEAARAAADWPAPQLEQVDDDVAPVAVETVPAGQLAQLAAPLLAWK